MADNPNKKKKDCKQVSQQEHEKRYQATKETSNKQGSKSRIEGMSQTTVRGSGKSSGR